MPLLPHIPEDTDTRAFLAPAELSDDALAHLREGDTVEAFLTRLIDEREFSDAIRVVARSLHHQHAVAWALDSASAAPPNPDSARADTESKLLALVQQWLDEPGDTPVRRDAHIGAEDAGYNGPAAWAAAAVGWSGGSITPATLPPVEPPVGLCARAASAAIIIASLADPDHIEKNTEAALRVGLDYAAQDPPKDGIATDRLERQQPQPSETEDETEKPRLRSLRRSPGETAAPEPKPQAPEPPPPSAPSRSLRRRSSGSSGWGSGGSDSDSGGWDPKPL